MLEKEIKIICAWCKKDIGYKKIKNTNETPITHGICVNCAKKLLSTTGIPMKNFLDKFEKPVFLVNEKGEILTANNLALNMLNKDISEIENELGGDVFNCKYAELPNGCGNTIHCKACTIRMTVMKTMETGESQIKIPAYPDLNHITKENKIKFLITTEKVNNYVLLRIDEITEETI